MRKACLRIVIVLGWLFAHSPIGAAIAAETAGEAVALVTDVQGKAELSSTGEMRAVTVMTAIAPGAEVVLGSASRMVLVWLATGEELTFAGPASIRFSAAEAQLPSGASPSRRASALKDATVRFPNTGITQTAVVMRSGAKGRRIRLLSPAGTNTLEPTPEFRWQAIPGVSQYRVELTDIGGRRLLERDVAGDAYRLPSTITLEDGVSYIWGVSARLPDGRIHSNHADFKLLPAEQRARVERLRPSADASVAERVAFAAWLHSQELFDEARKYWKDAAVERPEDDLLRKLAAE
jgi:hypothetical protein